jgi:hypothetical protein
MCKKAMEKLVVKVIRETHCKEREEKGLKNLQITSLQMNEHFNVYLLKVQ